MRRLSWVLMVAVLLGALVAGSIDHGGPRTNAERAHAIATTIKCPECRSQSVAESDASSAKAVRLEIARRVDAGQTDAQIRDFLASRYGESILLTPSRSGFTGLVWALPVAALVVALCALAAAFRRWRATGSVAATEEDRALVAQALSER